MTYRMKLQTKTLLESYKFHNLDQYFQLCVDSYINGQKTQAKEQVANLQNDVKYEFINYVEMLNDYEMTRFFIKAAFEN